MTTKGTSRSPNLAELISEAFDIRLGDLHTALPGRIESYDAAKQEADVKPLIKRLISAADGDEILEEIPVIPNVPIAFPRAGGYFVTFPLAKGDHVLLIFAERSIDNYQAGVGIDSDPDDFRMHSLTDAVAIPGWYPEGKSLPTTHATNLVIGRENGPEIHIKGTEIHIGEENATDFLALGPDTETRLLDVYNAIKNAVIVAQDGGASLKATIIAALDLAGLPGAWPKTVSTVKTKAT